MRKAENGQLNVSALCGIIFFMSVMAELRLLLSMMNQKCNKLLLTIKPHVAFPAKSHSRKSVALAFAIQCTKKDGLLEVMRKGKGKHSMRS